MSRIQSTFRKLKKENRKALITFITAGDPSLTMTERLVPVLERAGVDIIELGVPFSDPMADGPVIQLSSERALKKGVTLTQILKLVERIRKTSSVPLLLMGYYNPIFAMGHQVFAEKAAKAGVDAVLVVDLPPEEATDLRRVLRSQKIDLVYLLAPTSSPDRIEKVARVGSGFIYYVSMTGVTGAKLQVTEELGNQVKIIRRITKLPVAVGFGISSPKDAAQIAPLADGVVIGSALVKKIGEGGPTSALLRRVESFVKSLKNSIN